MNRKYKESIWYITTENTYIMHVYSNIYMYLGGCTRLGLYPNQNSVTKSKRYLNAIGVRKV